MPESVSMADVAAKAGVSQATVSRALKDHPRISAAQRKRILRIAEGLGYRPNPLVSALMAVRRSPRGQTGPETIAFLSSHARPREWVHKPSCVAAFAGIEERATELGFKVEVFATREHASHRRLEKVLHARGIRGVILGFTEPASETLELNEAGLAIAGLARYFPNLAVDRTQVHGFYNVKLGLGRLAALGYRRTALVVPRYNNALVGNTWSAAFLDHQWSLPKARRCEPFLPETAMPSLAAFTRWIKRERPDAILAYKVDVLTLLARMRVSVPEQMAVAFLYRTREEVQQAAGVDENLHQVGRATVDLVAAKLHTNRLGPSDSPREVLTCGHWRDGPTVPAKSDVAQETA